VSSSERLPGLDTLRAIAIVWVMLFHSFLMGGLGPDWSWLSRFGWMGVDLFFVLSGFLIGTQVLAPLSEGKRLSFGDFYVRRAFRILPAFCVALMLYIFWPAFREAEGMEPWWKFLTFTINLNIDYLNRGAFSHAWSLCVEEHFYLLFPILAVGLLHRPAQWKFAALCIALVLGAIALRAVLWRHGMDGDQSIPRNWFVEDIYYPTWNRLDGLLCGVMLATLKTFRPQAWRNARRFANLSSFAGLCVLALAFWLFSDRTGLLANTLGWPILSLGLGLMVFAAAGRDCLVGTLHVPLLGWLAGISYSLYLVHKGVYHVVQAHWGPLLADTGLLAVCAYGGAAILGGAALHYTVERPFLQLRVWLKTSRDTPALA
jgi:peptidoglycan/LPS O-acetylase OafA/YrhL